MNTECPQCHCKFDAKRNKKGAAYALEWTELKPWHIEFLKWWVRLYPLDILTKQEMKDGYVFVGQSAINARISELKAWDLVKQVEDGYKLDLGKVMTVLERKGKLVIEDDYDHTTYEERLY